jgi:hypothetical protein
VVGVVPDPDYASNGRLSILKGQELELSPVALTTIWWLCGGAIVGLIVGAVGIATAAQGVTASYWALGVSLALSLAGGIVTVALIFIRNRQLFLAQTAADGLADLADALELEPDAALQAVGGVEQAQVISRHAEQLYERLASADALNEARVLGKSISRFRAVLLELTERGRSDGESRA